MLKGNILFCVLILFLSAFKSTIAIAEIDQITGHEIKKQAAHFFKKNDLSVELLVSDSRRFHQCDDGLDFKPRVENDWTSVIIACGETGWQKVLRAHSTPTMGVLLVSFEDSKERKMVTAGVKDCASSLDCLGFSLVDLSC